LFVAQAKTGGVVSTTVTVWLQVALFAAAAIVVIRRSLHVRVLSFVGTVSYSMYLFHVAILEVVMAWVPPDKASGTPIYLLCLALTLAATVILAKLSGLTLEKWSSDLGRLIVSRIGGRGARWQAASSFQPNLLYSARREWCSGRPEELG